GRPHLRAEQGGRREPPAAAVPDPRRGVRPHAVLVLRGRRVRGGLRPNRRARDPRRPGAGRAVTRWEPPTGADANGVGWTAASVLVPRLGGGTRAGRLCLPASEAVGESPDAGADGEREAEPRKSAFPGRAWEREHRVPFQFVPASLRAGCVSRAGPGGESVYT